MRLGSMNRQVNDLFLQSEIFSPGASKHDAKDCARNAGASGWHEVGKQLNIYSFATAEQYKHVWHQAANWVKAEYAIRDIKQIEGSHMADWLRCKIDVDGIAKSTFSQYASALEKFGVAISRMTGKPNDFAETLKGVRTYAKNVLSFSHSGRAYQNPEFVISALSRPVHRLVAIIQLEAGARVHEVGQLRNEKLTEAGAWVSGKGGHQRELKLSPETMRELREHFAANGGKMRFDYDAYREDLKKACDIAGEKYSGTHSYRYSYAVRSFNKHLANCQYLEALKRLSVELGHHRFSISKLYIR